MSYSNSNPPLPIPISQASPIAFEGDLFFPVAKPGDNTPYYVLGNGLPGCIAPVGPIVVVSLQLTQAQLLATFSSPIVLVEPPGVNMTLGFVFTRYDILPGNDPYISPDGGPQIWFGTASGTAFDSYALGTLFGQTQQSVVQGVSNLVATIVPRAGIENQPLVLASPSANMSGGNGTATLTIAYSIIPLTPS